MILANNPAGADCREISSLYDALKRWLSQPDDWAHLGHLTTCVWMVVALIQTGEVNLTRYHLDLAGRE